ncbi:hypothetical protein KTG15_07380 [Methanobacterium sp. YSL]|nr:hypothetical protein [Methanobacterium sp. YSL]
MESNNITKKKVVFPLKKDNTEGELRPEFVEKIKEQEKEPTVKIKNFKKHFDLDEHV